MGITFQPDIGDLEKRIATLEETIESRIAILDLHDGDIVLVKAKGKLSISQGVMMRDNLMNLIPNAKERGIKFAILDDGMEIQILRDEECTAIGQT